MPEQPRERHVAGLWCTEVMGHLPDYVDGALVPKDLAAVEAHLRGCDWCARFGGEYAAAVQQLQHTLATPQPLEDDVSRRLSERLQQEFGSEA